MRKFIIITLIVLGFVTVGSMTFFDEYFYRTRPRQSDPKTGRIYVQDVKSNLGVARVYLTRSEKMPFDYIWYVSPALSFAIIATAYVLMLKKRKSSASFKLNSN